MNKVMTAKTLLLSAALLLISISPFPLNSVQDCQARGFVGGHWTRFAKFDPYFRDNYSPVPDGFGNRAYGDRGVGDYDDERLRSNPYDAFNRALDQPGGGSLFKNDRPDAFTGPGDAAGARGSVSTDDGVRNYGTQRSLSSDGGFSSVFRPIVSPQAVRSSQTVRVSSVALGRQGYAVRDGFHNYNVFGRSWWTTHPGSFWRADWNDYWPWRWGSWNEFAGWWGVPLSVWPVFYDYGDTIYYGDNGNVYYGTDPICSASDYYQQAYDLANSGQGNDFGESASAPQSVAPPPPADKGKADAGNAGKTQADKKASKTKESGQWKPFGVYSLVQGGQTSSSVLFQICSNKKGQIKGNYYNMLTNESMPITGSIDKKIMRASWYVGNEKSVIYDTGVANLLKGESPVLIHFSRTSTQQWNLIRMKNPHAEADKPKV